MLPGRYQAGTCCAFSNAYTLSACMTSTLTGCCCLLQEEIEKYRGENVTADSERHRELSELEERLSETQEQAAWYQHKHQAAVKRVDQLKVHSHTKAQTHAQTRTRTHSHTTSAAQSTKLLSSMLTMSRYTHTQLQHHRHQAAVKHVDHIKVHSPAQTHTQTQSHTAPAPQAPSCCLACQPAQGTFTYTDTYTYTDTLTHIQRNIHRHIHIHTHAHISSAHCHSMTVTGMCHLVKQVMSNMFEQAGCSAPAASPHTLPQYDSDGHVPLSTAGLEQHAAAGRLQCTSCFTTHPRGVTVLGT